MGFLTTIVLKNDALHAFKAHPKEFAETLFEGMVKADLSHQETDIGFKGYCNYITAFPPRHADTPVVFYQWGNTVIDIDDNKFLDFADRHPKKAVSVLRDAKRQIDARIKKIKTQHNIK